MTIAILQSNYLPWKGYFDIIHDVDLFLFFDEVQYTVRDWRNRNRILSPQGASWISVPCGNDTSRRICDVTIHNELSWTQDHWNAIRNAYAKTPCFDQYSAYFQQVYFGRKWEYLSDLNQTLIQEISHRFLGITTRFARSSAFPSTGHKTEKLLTLCQSVGCDTYLSGPAAKNYLDESAFEKAGIRVVWKDYTGYPAYPQQGDQFRHDVSIIDMLFRLGEKTPEYIWGWRLGATH